MHPTDAANARDVPPPGLSREPRSPRHKTREVAVGDKVVGGDNPIWVQSMTTPDTYEVEATVGQIHRLEEAGCEIVRVTVPKPEDAAVLGEIKRRIHIPLICDIHFDYKMALAALDHPVDKIRINPGNIGGYDRYRQVIRKAKDKGMPMRIGVNAGSLERELARSTASPARRPWSIAPCATSRSPSPKAITTSSCR